MLTWKDIVSYTNNGAPEPTKRVEKSEAEWRKILSPKQFEITRLKHTEAPGTGEFCSSHEAGKYGCVCCHTLLFDSTIKFESGTGWPSFTSPITPNAVNYVKDTSFGTIRVETICNTCDAHLGHVFPDGPPPSGLRFCINSAALVLIN